MPFRQAHHVTGRVVALASSRGVALEQLTLADLRAIEPAFEEDVLAVLGVDESVASRRSYGGAAPANVAQQAALWRERLGDKART